MTKFEKHGNKSKHYQVKQVQKLIQKYHLEIQK